MTTGAGLYSFPAVQPGVYDVKVENPGFRTATTNGIELQVQQTARVDFTLQVGQLTESVEVMAAVVQLNTDDATVGTVIENRRIVDLPLNGRDYLQLVALSPNVSFGFANGGQADSRQGGTPATSRSRSPASAASSTTSHLTAWTTPTSISTAMSVLAPILPMLGLEEKRRRPLYRLSRESANLNAVLESGIVILLFQIVGTRSR